MEKIIDPHLFSVYRKASQILSVVVGVIGFAALMGWEYNIDFLKGISSNFVSLKVNSAICFILISVSLILHQSSANKFKFILAKLLALSVIFIGIVLTYQNVTGIDLLIDNFFFQDTGLSLYSPGRVPPITSISFILVGVALLIANFKRLIIIEDILVILIGLAGLLIIISATYHIESSERIIFYTRSSLFTAVNLFLISIALLFLKPNQGIAILLTSNTTGGESIRRVLPPIILLPIVFGYLRLYGWYKGWYDDELGTALFVVVMIFCAALVSFLVSARLMQEDINRRQAEGDLFYRTKHDMLTKFDNKASFEEKINSAIKNWSRRKNILAIIFIDIDNFKKINDSLGHLKGDNFIVQVGNRLKGLVKRYNSIARFSGDEFAILLTRQRGIEEIIAIANLILKSMAKPFFIDGKEFYISASIGISCYPSDGADAVSLLRNADIAMYEAKARGKNCYQFCPENLQVLTQERVKLENSLHHAIERDELVVYYQPVVDLKTDKPTSLEALLYWHSDQGRVITPSEFIPIAEQSSLILLLGEWILREACLQVKKWHPLGVRSVSVNVSVQQLHTNFIETVIKILTETNLDPQSLILEITESGLMQETESAAFVLNSLREMGVRISIDDFGTGYSSFKYIKDFKVDYIKIDRSFVKDIPHDKNSQAIALAAIAMAHALNIKVITEGIETPEQLAFFREKGAEQYQGFYFSKPQPPEEIEILLRRHLNKEAPEKDCL